MASDPEQARPVAGIILAAGLGSRMGGTKVLLPWQGRPLIRHLAEIALAAPLDSVLVVTGHQPAEVAAALADLPVALVHNPDYEHGLSTSVRAGLAALSEHMAAALIMLADQPLLTSAVIDQLIEAYWRTSAPIVAPFANGRRGNPVLFDRSLFAELQTLTGDEGARRVIATHRTDICAVEVAPDVLEDVDTPEAYHRLTTDHRPPTTGDKSHP